MLFKLLLFVLLAYSLGASEKIKSIYLQSNYFVKDDFVMLSDIVKKPTKDVQLYSINPNRHTKRVKAKELLKNLKKQGYKNFASKHNYVQFSKKSPINSEHIKEQIKKEYQKRYSNIEILSLQVEPRAYMEKLPRKYQFEIDDKEYLSNEGICSIKTQENKKIFFNYHISAKITVYKTRTMLKRGTELSNMNIQKKSIMLDKFRAAPIQTLSAHSLEAKHRLKAETILTQRDVTGLYLVKRGATVVVFLNDGGINISFTAKAVTNGRYGDKITVLRSDDKKIKVRVSGQNRAEM